MPLQLKFLKKCRQYNVTSKSLFVISVHHLLDTTTAVDCTISSEDKGQECLDNVCQRLLIQQPEFFGLRYVVKGKEDEMKWIDLERSLSRQIEKYASGTKIYLRLRHFVTTGVRHFSDEVSRYYYFLQLKSDISEGKIACDIRTAILLALYCRQAEYDSYQNDKQTKDYGKKSLVLPKNLQGLANDDNMLDSLIAEVLQQHSGIQHLNQMQAEEMYIQCCQQLDGYGEERFKAKDTLGNDLLLGLAINGIVVTADNGRQYFPWKDFTTVTIDKRTIKIEQNKADGSIVGSFIFSESDMARYFWKLCITQHKFFKRYIDEDSPSLGEDSINGISIGGGTEAGLGNSSGFAYDFIDSREDLLLEQQQRAIYTSGSTASVLTSVGASQPDFMSVQTMQHNHNHHQQQQHQQQQHQQQQQQQQLPTHSLLTANNSSGLMSSSNISLAASHQSGGGGGGSVGGSGALPAHIADALAHAWLNKDYTHDFVSSQHLPSSILDTRLQSSSCLDLSKNNLHSSNSILSHINTGSNLNNNHLLAADTQERERLKALLPTYRPAPDYETAVQLKYRTPSSELHNLSYQNAAAASAATALAVTNGGVMPAYYAGSQPDVHNAAVYGDGLLLSAHRYPDVAQPAAAMHAHHHLAAAAANMALPAGLTAGGNGGPTVGSMYIDLPQRYQIMRSKPPPPYPVNRLSSSSTPDLANPRTLLGIRAYVSGSSPDLVSNRNLPYAQYAAIGGGGGGGGGGVMNASSSSAAAAMMQQYVYANHMGHSQSYLPPHGTFENLNMIEEQPSIVSQLRQSALSQAAAAQAANQSYERNSPTGGYHASMTNTPPTSAPPPLPTASSMSQVPPAPLQRNAMNGSIEPIYENVPLPAAYTNTPQRNNEQRASGSGSSTHANESMRNRTSSIQSAPGGIHGQQQPPVPAMRQHYQHSNGNGNANSQILHHQQQQQQQQQHHQHAATELDMDTHVSMKHRAASTELQYLEPVAPPQRVMRAASAAPAIGQTPPPRQHKTTLMKTSSSISAVDVIPANGGRSSRHQQHTAHDDAILQQQFGAMNLSASSSIYNSTLDTSSGTHAYSTSASSITTKEPKRKKRWNILGRSKTPDKQKSATLGREKANNSNSNANKLSKAKLAQDDLNLTHRWSTGVVPKLQPISGQYSKDKLCQILNDKLNDSQLYMEFEAIPKRRDLPCYNFALMEENKYKNANPHFLPYDDNRVRIRPNMENRTGYVNASHISATVGTKQRFYIVAQSPHDDLTMRIFWQCVWEADVYLIVQLSDDFSYIPPNTQKCLEFGQFRVYQEFSQTTDRCITSKLRLHEKQSRCARSVWHLNYTDWAEQNCPRDVNNFLDFLEELNSVRMASINEVPPGHNTNPPVLIHCHEGGGRSGVTLTADLLLYTLNHNEDLDIPRVIGQLRLQRDSIIPSLAQYKFIYCLLITYLKRTRLI